MKRKVERLKDILIDHVYDYCNNEIVQRMEGRAGALSFEDPRHLEDPVMKSMAKEIKESGNLKAYYTTRNGEYCEIFPQLNKIKSSFMIKLNHLGFSASNKLPGQIEKAKDFLIARSYLAANRPMTGKVKLTEKGIRHYLDGKSFEDSYINRRNSNIAVVISIGSIVIALIALFA